MRCRYERRRASRSLSAPRLWPSEACGGAVQRVHGLPACHCLPSCTRGKRGHSLVWPSLCNPLLAHGSFSVDIPIVHIVVPHSWRPPAAVWSGRGKEGGGGGWRGVHAAPPYLPPATGKGPADGQEPVAKTAVHDT